MFTNSSCDYCLISQCGNGFLGSLSGGKYPENKVAVRAVKEVTVHPGHPKGTSLFLLKGELWSRSGDE